MPFHLITGRAHAGKSGILGRYVAEALDAGQQPVLLLPTQADVRRARAEMAQKHPIGAAVTTFDAWLETMWSLHGDGRRFVGALTRDALIARACDAVSLNAAERSSATPGFQKMVATVASRLRTAPGPATDAVSRDIGAVIAAYYRLLCNEGLIEPAHAANLLAQSLPPLDGPLIVNRFVDLSGAQEALLTALSAHSLVAIALVWEEGFISTEALDELVGRLREIADHHEHVPSGEWNDELTRLEACLYTGPNTGETRSCANGSMVEFGLAAGSDAEIQLVADRVSQLVTEGVPADRIAIAFRDLSRRAGQLKATLDRAGVPASLDALVPLGSTPYGKAFRSLIEVALARSGREALYAFLASPYSGAEKPEVIAADKQWRTRRMEDVGTLLKSSGRFGRQASETIRLAQTLSREPITSTTGKKWKELADRLLVASVDARASSEERLLDAAAHRAVLNAIRDALDLTSAEFTAGELLSVLQTASVSLSSGDRPGHVQITDVSRLRSRRYDVVIVGGLTAGEFSAEYREPLVARYARTLGGHGGTDESLSERMLFYLLATRARKKLILVRQSTNERGEPLRASVFWDEVVDLYRDHSAEDFDAIPPGVPVMRLGVADLPRVMPAVAADRATARSRVSGGRLRSHRRLHVAAGEKLAEHFAQTDTFSVTELESYLQCPYKWFYGRSVRPREIDAALGVRELGSHAHTLLNEFYVRFHEQTGEERVCGDNLSDALVLFDTVADEIESELDHLGERSFAEQLDLSKARRRAAETVAADATFLPGFRPVAHELRFGFDGTPEVEIEGVRLRGSIDRVDLGPAGAVVIDYKSGSTVSPWTKFESEGCLQPAIYAIVASGMLDAPVAGGVYRPLGGNRARGFWRGDLSVPFEGGPRIDDRLDEEGVNAVLESARRRLGQAIEGLRSGNIAPRPLGMRACTYCGVSAFCPEAVS